MYRAENSFEPFIVFEVKAKSVAEDDIVDFYDHIVMKGEQYITGIYLEWKDMPTKGIFHDKKHKRDVYILPGEVVLQLL